MHQVTACALSALLHEAYEAFGKSDVPIETWAENCAKLYPTFRFWLLILNLEILLLNFVRSVRLGDFELYQDSLRKMCPWYFALNHQNYARWLPVHVRDMQELNAQAPGIHEAFAAG